MSKIDTSQKRNFIQIVMTEFRKLFLIQILITHVTRQFSKDLETVDVENSDSAQSDTSSYLKRNFSRAEQP